MQCMSNRCLQSHQCEERRLRRTHHTLDQEAELKSTLQITIYLIVWSLLCCFFAARAARHGCMGEQLCYKYTGSEDCERPWLNALMTQDAVDS